MQRFLEGPGNTSHAYINGLSGARKRRTVPFPIKSKLVRRLRDLKLGGKDDGQSSIS